MYQYRWVYFSKGAGIKYFNNFLWTTLLAEQPFWITFAAPSVSAYEYVVVVHDKTKFPSLSVVKLICILQVDDYQNAYIMFHSN